MTIYTIRIVSGSRSSPSRANPTAVTNANAIMVPRRTWRRSAVAVTNGRTVNRESDGAAVMNPIQDTSTPIAFSQTGKNGRWTPMMPNVEA